jgi:hypothetical protein
MKMITAKEFESLFPLCSDTRSTVLNYLWFAIGDLLKFDYFEHPFDKPYEHFWRVVRREGLRASEKGSLGYPAADTIDSLEGVSMFDALAKCFVPAVAFWKKRDNDEVLSLQLGVKNGVENDDFVQETEEFVKIRRDISSVQKQLLAALKVEEQIERYKRSNTLNNEFHDLYAKYRRLPTSTNP